jgi:hypothetical protein
MTTTEAKWSARVREWRWSGKTAVEYASASDFKASTLRYWASRLKASTPAKPALSMARVVRRQTPGVADSPSISRGSAREVEVRVGDARIVVRPGFDAELLRQVTRALGDAR